MSFGGGGFGSGFGQQNNNTQSTGFGGFGQNNNNTSAFGSSTGGGFGQTNNTSGTSLFGGGTANNTANSGGFGSGTGAFGSTNTFGATNKPAFGSTGTTGGLFGAANTANNAGSSTFGGGFGAANNTNTSSPFGGGSGGGLFGSSNTTQNKPAFGATGGTSLFGGGGTTANTGFGGGAFGSSNAGAGNVGDPPGTAVTPFAPTSEKEPNGTSTNVFQNLLFQDPYKKWSSEELRLADYAQGRKHGNGNNSSAGAFGSTTGFGSGGFGATNTQTPAFGSTNNTSTTGGGLFGSAGGGGGFGQSNTGGFGSTAANSNTANNSGGIFGSANKPGGLFGSTQNQQQSGGLFGGGANTSGTTGFGATNTSSPFGGANNNTTTGGGLFGSNNQAAKPQGTGFGFGSTNTNTQSPFGGSTSGAFGSTSNNTNTGTSAFGASTQQSGGGLFGNAGQQQQQNTGSAFGGFGQQSQNQQSGGGLFGSTQQKPAGGLFGNAQSSTPAASGGLFGSTNNQQQQPTTGFGATNTTNTGTGLFGGANKPATGLFGGANTQANTTGGGLFGSSLNTNTQNQQTGGTGLFGAANNQQQQKPSLFGTSTQSTGTGMFGGQNNQAPGASLFGGSTQQQSQGLGNSLLGNSQQANTPQGLTANLNDVSAYGSPSLFASIGSSEVSNPGPLATPLNGNTKPKRNSILPMYKLAPQSASRYSTPQKRGFGFSYSTYNTPGGSPASSIASTPGTLGRSLLGSSSSQSLSKSMSTNNLRRNFNGEDSILAPGAFSASSGPRWYGSTGSKKLIINREIRSDLFSTPQKDKQAFDSNSGSRKLSKRVSFDTSNVEAEEEPIVRGALPAPDGSPSTQVDDTPRQRRSPADSNGSKTPEADQVKSSELTAVSEEDNTSTPGPKITGFDNAPGQYWTEPAFEELQEMNRVQRQKIDRFTVGRENVGFIEFQYPVDISGIELDELCGGVIQLEPRSATVYPIAAKKPPVGKGLNVPAKITLEQSWPRGGRDKRIASDPKRFNKHIERLKRIPDTTFVSYDKDTGVWSFSVEHFTTYGLDDSDDDSDEEIQAPEQEPGEPLPDPMQIALDPSDVSSIEEDTFDFMRPRGVPGAFDDQPELSRTTHPSAQSFLGVSSADSGPNAVALTLENDDVVEMAEEYDLSGDEDMTRSSPGQHHAAEHIDASSEVGHDAQQGTPGGVLRARMRAMKDAVAPLKIEVADGDDWMEMLRKTVSPVKRDRQLLRNANDSPSKRGGQNIDVTHDDELRKSSIWKKSTARAERMDDMAASAHISQEKGRGFATSIDLMNSLFEHSKPVAPNFRASTAPSKGFPKWPYERQDKVPLIKDSEQQYHDIGRPSWGPQEVLLVSRDRNAADWGRATRGIPDVVAYQRTGIQTEQRELRVVKLSTESSKKYLSSQDRHTDIRLVEETPKATLHAASVLDVFHNQDLNDPAKLHEKRVWELASILFDTTDDEPQLDPQSDRKARLSTFWTDLVDQASSTAIGLAGSSEEKAVACLAGHRIAEACKNLLDGKNFHLSTLVPLIGSSDDAKRDMKEQLQAWHDSKVLSEFSEPIRAIYELLSGNVCVCEGMKNVPVEDRIESFVISRKFGLDWKQAFGLRLWYSISPRDDLSKAVNEFQDDIQQDREVAPQPWYAEQGIKPLWDDKEAETRQDLLWGLLRLYSDSGADLEAILRPENSQLSPFDIRLSWQLGLALVGTGKLSYGENGAEKADAVTIAYASQLTCAGEWLEAVFVLLHLSNSSSRHRAIQEHLCRHAHLIGSETGSNFNLLKEKFLIPTHWIWEALALYKRSVQKDSSGEVHCLLQAGSFFEAHKVFAQQVAPLAIIERDYGHLSSLISQFKGYHEQILDWGRGGEIYALFLSLLQHRQRGEVVPRAILDKLAAGLHAMSEDATEADLIRYAAVSDMADETAQEMLRLTRRQQLSQKTKGISGFAPGDEVVMSRPKNWPETVTYLTAPLHCQSLKPEQLRGLKTNSNLKAPGTTPLACETLARLPASATQTPCPLVKIQTITEPGHPANGQRGLFAARDLKPGSFIVPYLGRVHDGTQGSSGTDPESDYDLWLDRDVAVAVDAARQGNEARFVNDYRGVADRPNAEFGTAWSDRWGQRCAGFWVMAAPASGKGNTKGKGKDKRSEGIKKGEEILVSYGKGFWGERKAAADDDE